jgi:hypothetical protein
LSEFEQALERLDSDTAAVQKAAATVAGASKRSASKETVAAVMGR